MSSDLDEDLIEEIECDDAGDAPPTHQIWVMPWAALPGNVQVGHITIWSANEISTQVEDASVQKFLDRYLTRFVDQWLQPIRSLFICTHGTPDFRILNEQERSDLSCAIDALIFSIIAPSVRQPITKGTEGWRVPHSADRYEVIGQNTNLVSDWITRPNGSSSWGIWQIKDIWFSRPWHLGGMFGLVDEDLLKALSNLLLDEAKPDFRARITRSLEWFRLAHTEVSSVSPLSKVVMMVTAFEILLAMSFGSKTADFCSGIGSLCETPETLQETRTDDKNRSKTYSKIRWWAWEFYELRNAISHQGMVVPEKLMYSPSVRGDVPMLYVADIAFLECVIRLLEREGYYRWEEKHPEIFAQEMSAEEANFQRLFLLHSQLDHYSVHTSLGWTEKINFDGKKQTL